MGASITSEWTYPLVQCHKSLQNCLLFLSLSLSHQTKSFSMSYNCSTSLSEEEEGSLSAWWKCPSGPPIIFILTAFLSLPHPDDIRSRSQRSRQKMTPCHPIGLRPHVDHGNPRWHSIRFCLTAGGGDELVHRHLLDTINLYPWSFFESSVSFVCVFGFEAMNRINGDNAAHFWKLSPHRHSGFFTIVHVSNRQV